MVERRDLRVATAHDDHATTELPAGWPTTGQPVVHLNGRPADARTTEYTTQIAIVK